MGFSSMVAAVLSLAVLVAASGVEEGQSEHAAHELVTRYGYLNTTNSWTGSKKIILESSDGEVFEVEESVAVQSQTIKRMIEADNIVIIPIQNVTGKILSKVIEYCKHHLNSGECDLEAFDANFVKVDHDTLFELILAANYLDIKSLLDLTGQTLGEMIKGKSVEEIRKMFNITNDYTPQAEEEVRREKKWALQ